MLPFGTEGCPYGEDIGHRPLREPMPRHPTPEPLGEGASGYRYPLLRSEDYWTMAPSVPEGPKSFGISIGQPVMSVCQTDLPCRWTDGTACPLGFSPFSPPSKTPLRLGIRVMFNIDHLRGGWPLICASLWSALAPKLGISHKGIRLKGIAKMTRMIIFIILV
jgi:hypothetical protein